MNFDERYELGPEEARLLQCLLLKSPDAGQRAAECMANVDFDALAAPLLRLIPPIFDRIGRSAKDDSQYERMAGIYRYFHYRNTILLTDGRQAIERLLYAGVDCLLFKGIAVALKYHRNRTTRPMGDIDVLVRDGSQTRAEQIVRQCGFRPLYSGSRVDLDVHSRDFVNHRLSAFDLHWHALPESPVASIDDGLWQRAKLIEWDGLVVKVMSPEDLLLTGIVNGVREPSPMKQPHWIHDLATIVAAEPHLVWDLVWGEARERGLRMQVFDALNLVRGFADDVIPARLLENFLDQDPAFRRTLLSTARAEGRTFPLGKPFETLPASSQPYAPQHIRFFRNPDGEIERIFLDRRHLPYVCQVFDLADPDALEEHTQRHGQHSHITRNIPPGLLRIRKPGPLPAYSACVCLRGEHGSHRVRPGQTVDIPIEVSNTSSYCWPVSAGSRESFGVSGHLYSHDGNLLLWDLPRTWLVTPRKNYVAFMEPSRTLSCELRLTAPRKPGRYVVKLDIVHEHVLWFSSRGMEFPQIEIEVPKEEEVAPRYSIHPLKVHHETIAGKTAIVNVVSGDYFTTTGSGSFIWNAIAAGFDLRSIASALASANMPDASDVVADFMLKLVEDDLVVASDTVDGAQGQLQLPLPSGDALPSLTRHQDARALIATMPFGSSDAQTGWPSYR